MASRIAGITIEIGGDTTDLQKSLKAVDSQLEKTQGNLKDINKLLKMDPKNVDLLRQKQENLSKAISETETRLEELKKAQSKVAEGSEEWDAIQREIIETENKLKTLEKQQRQFGSVASQVLKAAGRDVKEFGSKVSDAGKKLSGISAGAAAIGTGLLKMGYDAVTAADEINTLSQQTGLTTDEIQKLQYASDLIDVSFEDVSGALKKFKGKIDPANESLQKLGVSTTNADGSLRDVNDVFFDTVQALSGIDNETERDQVAMDLFGKSADSLAGIIDDGGEAFRNFGQQAEDLGLILDKDTLDSLNATNDTIDQLKANLAGTAAQIGADVGTVLAPLLQQLATWIGTITAKLREMNPATMETILKIVAVVAAIAPVVIIIGKLITGIGAIIGILPVLISPIGLVVAAIAAVIAIGVLLWKNWDKIKAAAVKVKDKVVEIWNSIKEKVAAAIDNIKGKIDNLKQKFEDLKNKVVSIWNTIKGVLTGQIKLPKIPLPHFKVDPPGWKIGDLLKGTIPKLKIDWYKKAYNNPVMFTSPTVMATPNGYKGFGDGTGAEIVMGLDKLRELVGSGQNVNVTVVLEGDARNLFKAVQKTNLVRTKATNYNALAVGV